MQYTARQLPVLGLEVPLLDGADQIYPAVADRLAILQLPLLRQSHLQVIHDRVNVLDRFVHQHFAPFGTDRAAFGDGAVAAALNRFGRGQVVRRTGQLHGERQMRVAAGQHTKTEFREQLELVSTNRNVTDPHDMNLRR